MSAQHERFEETNRRAIPAGYRPSMISRGFEAVRASASGKWKQRSTFSELWRTSGTQPFVVRAGSVAVRRVRRLIVSQSIRLSGKRMWNPGLTWILGLLSGKVEPGRWKRAKHLPWARRYPFQKLHSVSSFLSLQ